MPRHSLVVRLTHWINAIASFALIVSGVAILLAHPRLYWGETGAARAPLRLRVARQLGYKSVKYLSRIAVAESMADFGQGLGGASPEEGYSWWAGI